MALGFMVKCGSPSVALPSMPVLETPSRVWRRIQAADDLAVPSLPSLPGIDSLDEDDDDDNEPAASKLFESARNSSFSTKKSTTTTVRFADKHESFEFSEILPITHQSLTDDTDDGDKLPMDYSIQVPVRYLLICSAFAELL